MAVDLSKLTPAEMAAHLGRPDGDVGNSVSLQMNKTNGNITLHTYRRLGLGLAMDVLEIGPANGHMLPELIQIAPGMRYTGLDISEIMVAEANRFNAARVAAGQASFRLGNAASVPLADASLDRVFAINVVYFWPDALAPLREIRRVLRPSGFSVIAAISPDTVAASASPAALRGDNFHHRDAASLIALHQQAGFRDVQVEMVTEFVRFLDGRDWQRDYNLVIARP